VLLASPMLLLLRARQCMSEIAGTLKEARESSSDVKAKLTKLKSEVGRVGSAQVRKSGREREEETQRGGCDVPPCEIYRGLRVRSGAGMRAARRTLIRRFEGLECAWGASLTHSPPLLGFLSRTNLFFVFFFS